MEASGVLEWLGAAKNILLILQAIGTIILAIGMLYMRSVFMPRKEIEAKVEDLRHSWGNKLSTGLDALRLEYKATDAAHSVELKGVVERVDRHENRLTAGEGRFALLEAALKNLPTEGSISALALAISELKGDVRVVSEKVAASEQATKVTAAQVTRMDDYLRRQEAHAA